LALSGFGLYSLNFAVVILAPGGAFYFREPDPFKDYSIESLINRLI
jgi:hypothetical protein